MAHFAKLNEENIVEQVIVIDNEVITDENGQEQESLGQAFCQQLLGHDNWKQTSYNGSFRKNYAGIGYRYDEVRDAFIPPEPECECTFNEETCSWDIPRTIEE